MKIRAAVLGQMGAPPYAASKPLPVASIDLAAADPPKTTKALRSCIASKDYSELALDASHSGVLASGKSQGVLGKGLCQWLHQRD